MATCMVVMVCTCCCKFAIAVRFMYEYMPYACNMKSIYSISFRLQCYTFVHDLLLRPACLYLLQVCICFVHWCPLSSGVSMHSFVLVFVEVTGFPDDLWILFTWAFGFRQCWQLLYLIDCLGSLLRVIYWPCFCDIMSFFWGTFTPYTGIFRICSSYSHTKCQKF